MSHCTCGTCLAHRRSVYWSIQERRWVHTDGWPCEALAIAGYGWADN